MATAVECPPGRAGIVVTGVGAVSPAGLGHRALWDAVRGGRVTTGPVTRFDTSRHPSHRAGEIPRSALSRLDSPKFEHTPIGIFRQTARPTYDEQLNAQVGEAQAKNGRGNLAKLLQGNDSWRID